MIPIVYIPQPQNEVAHKKTQYNMKPIGITVHNTANYAPARNEIEYMHISDDYRSFHFAVDDKEIIQGELTNMNTWHAGDGETGIGNRQTISIEICYSCYIDNNVEEYEKIWREQYKEKFEKAQENTAYLVAYLLMQYGWGFNPSRIYKHQDWSNKFCPHRTMTNGGWGYFLTQVEKAYSKLEEELPMTDTERAEFNALKSKVSALENKETADHTQVMNLINTLKGSVTFIGDETVMPFYKTLKDIPEDNWCRPTIEKLINKGYIKGNEKGEINITYVLARILTILDRANIF